MKGIRCVFIYIDLFKDFAKQKRIYSLQCARWHVHKEEALGEWTVAVSAGSHAHVLLEPKPPAIPSANHHARPREMQSEIGRAHV